MNSLMHVAVSFRRSIFLPFVVAIALLAGCSNYSSNTDPPPVSIKFTVPTVANGKVYVPTRGDDTTVNSPTNRGQINVYGLKPN